MLYRLAADLLVLFHLGFIIFVITGGFLVLKWRWVILLHLPAVVWGALIEFQGWMCPLTPLEQRLRQAAGEKGYAGGFIEHYVLPVIYPQALTADIQIVLGSFVILINLVAYTWVLVHMARNRKTTSGHSA
ncbi:MAG: DUF2784 domain-containing protein [Thiogranum sp.]|jgi:hypothetical protein